MNRKGFANILLIVIVITLVGVGVYVVLNQQDQRPSVPSVPSIERITPDEAAIGVEVTVVGSGFTLNKNSLQFGAGFAYLNNLISPDGKKITFTLPESFDTCNPDGTVCAEFLSRPFPGQIYEVAVINAGGTSNRVNFTVASEEARVLTITTNSPLPSAMVGKTYNRTINASGGSEDWKLILKVTAGSLPPGLGASCCLGVGGGLELKGIPTKAGTYTFTITAVDGNREVSKRLTLEVAAVQSRPNSVPYERDGTCPRAYVNYGIPLQCVTPEYMEYCQTHPCPICLAGGTLIDTLLGSVPVKDLQIGAPVWTMDKSGQRVLGVITKTSKALVPAAHQMVRVVLDDGRELFVSPGHPTIDGRVIGDLVSGEVYDSATVLSTAHVPYGEGATYDLLPSGDTGFYWANGILIGSTLR